MNDKKSHEVMVMSSLVEGIANIYHIKQVHFYSFLMVAVFINNPLFAALCALN